MGTLQSLFTLSFMALRGQGWVLFLWVKAHFADIALFSIVVSFLVSIWVYLSSFVGDKMLALGGNTGNPIYDVSALSVAISSIEIIQILVYDWP